MESTREGAEPVPVEALLDQLDRAIETLRRVTITATLSGWKTTNRRWGHGDLCAMDGAGTGVSRRLPMVVPPDVLLAAKRRLGDALADGALVVVNGRIQIGDRWNPLRIVVDRLDVLEAESAFTQQTRLLIAQLETSGAGTRNRELRLPATFGRIGLITPAGGEAGRADFLHQLAQSPAPVSVLERRVPMTGPNATAAITHALADLTEVVEAVFVCRGGGARADLVAFDSAEVATAIARCASPVIVAVGHTTDHTVADRVAHTSLPTPTAAADWIVRRAIDHDACQEDGRTERALIAERVAAQLAEQTVVRKRSEAARSKQLARMAVAAAVVLLIVTAALLIAR